MASQERIRVAVVFGGQSTEHSVSCVSAASVLANLDPTRFEVLPVGITQEGSWVLGPADPASAGDRGPHACRRVTSGTALTLPADPTSANLVVLERGREGEVLSAVDVVFPVLHGAYGEDGTIQGLLEMVGLPYAGAGRAGERRGDGQGVHQEAARRRGPAGRARTRCCTAAQATLSAAQRERLGLPVFVKPARAGSSTGITKVDRLGRTGRCDRRPRAAIDPKVLVESAIVGREVECGVLEFPDGRVEASLPAEIRIAAGGPDWYDFETKYLDDVAELDIPAKLDDAVTERLRAMAVEAFRALDCQGLARVDFFVGADGSLDHQRAQHDARASRPTSAYPKMWAVTGVDYPTLLSHPGRHGHRAGHRPALTRWARTGFVARVSLTAAETSCSGPVPGAAGHGQRHVDGAVHDVPRWWRRRPPRAATGRRRSRAAARSAVSSAGRGSPQRSTTGSPRPPPHAAAAGGAGSAISSRRSVAPPSGRVVRQGPSTRFVHDARPRVGCVDADQRDRGGRACWVPHRCPVRRRTSGRGRRRRPRPRAAPRAPTAARIARSRGRADRSDTPQLEHGSEMHHRAGEGSGDAVDVLDAGDHELAEQVDVVGLGAHDHVVGAGDILGGGHAGDLRDLRRRPRRPGRPRSGSGCMRGPRRAPSCRAALKR